MNRAPLYTYKHNKMFFRNKLVKTPVNIRGKLYIKKGDTGVPFHRNFNSILRRDHEKKKFPMSVAPMSR